MDEANIFDINGRSIDSNEKDILVGGEENYGDMGEAD
jgi:hypothetical protein